MERLVNQSPPFGHAYQTASGSVSLLNRLFPALTFYSRFVRVVLKASAAAKRGRYDDAAWCRSSLEIMRALEAIGVRFDITGMQNLQRLDSACVVVANHMSVMETVILPTIIQPFKRVTFIVKDSLMQYPVFKHVIATRDPIVVNRINPRQDLKTVMQHGTALLKKGVSVVVFPQTTRASFFDPELFNSLGVKLAARAKVPVVPLALVTDAWGNGRLIKEFGKIDTRKKVRLAFGSPLMVGARSAREHQEVIRFISSKLDLWQR